ncbi:MAG: AMP-binding protein [Cohaesibacteraceae bacterium]
MLQAADPSVQGQSAGQAMMVGQRPGTFPQVGNEPWRTSLFAALLDARERFGKGRMVVNDFAGTSLTYDRLVLGAILLGEKLTGLGKPSSPIGVLLPNASGVAAVFFGCQAAGRVPAMLNFSAGPRAIIGCCDAAEVDTIICSRAFVEKADLHDLVAELEKTRTFVWTEDLRASIGALEKLRGLARVKLGMISSVPGLQSDPDSVAALLFTSGTEGQPKGVALTHANFLSNCWQFAQVIDHEPGDTIFAALPLFHAYGLTVGLLAGVFLGVGVYLYPSPLHYKEIPGHVRRSKARIVVSTNTFVNGWMKNTEDGDFESVDLMVLGAERVSEQTRKQFRERFEVELLEGYGATEAGPVIAANHMEDNVDGTVGYLMPGMETRLDPIEGLETGGRLVVRGPNVMAGYVRVDAPGVIQPPVGGWHDTGDIVDFDEAGRVRIKGRAKRFAKLGGEMVSLTAVENYVGQVWPDDHHAVISLPDPRKGEMLVLVTEKQDPDLQDVRNWAQQEGVSELMLPKRAVSVEELPVLGTGKLNYGALDEIALDALGAAGGTQS